MSIPTWLTPWKTSAALSRALATISELQQQKTALDMSLERERVAHHDTLTKLKQTESVLALKGEAVNALTGWIMTTHRLREQQIAGGQLVDLLKKG